MRISVLSVAFFLQIYFRSFVYSKFWGPTVYENLYETNECTNYYCINILHLHYLKINISSELIEVQKRVRQIFYTAKLLYGELILRRNFLRRNCLTAKFRYGEISLRQKILTAILPKEKLKFPMAKFPSTAAPMIIIRCWCYN